MALTEKSLRGVSSVHTKSGYQLLKVDGTLEAIKCLDCQYVSFNTHDIEEKYCSACHKFHQPDARKE
jgi:hypothetical protein